MRILAIVLGFALASMAREAGACSCSMPGIDLPRPGATDVPTNVRVWVSANHPDGALSLVDPQDNVVPTEAGVVPFAGSPIAQRWLKPTAVLRPNADYSVRVEGVNEDGPIPLVVGTFTTGAGPDTTPPAVPTESERRPYVFEGNIFNGWSSCGDSYGAAVTFSPDAARSFIVARLTTDAAGEPADLASLSFGGLPDTVHLGRGGCSSSWPEAKRGASTPVVFAAYDLAGNFSGWTEPTTVVVDGDGHPGGCASAGSSLVAVVVFARRRRALRGAADPSRGEGGKRRP